MKPYPQSSKAANLSESGQPRHVRTSGRRSASSLLSLALFLALAPAALASSTWYVDGVNGSDSNNCKIRLHACKTIGHAISLASSGDSIMVAPATYTENLTVGVGLTITGSGAQTTIIDGGNSDSVVRISSTAISVTLSRVTIRNGKNTYGGGIYNSGVLRVIDTILSGNLAWYYGGGIYNSGTLIVIDSTLSGNTVSSRLIAFGGGIANIGTLTINKTTLSENLAVASECSQCGAGGGGIFNGGYVPLAINNSTLTGNRAVAQCSTDCGAFGGGISIGSGMLTTSNSTFNGNSATGSTSGIGGNIYTRSSDGTAILQNTIVANSPSGGNCGGSVTSNGYNLSSDGTCNFNGTGDLNNTDPKLGKLGNYGGPTQTIPLLSASPAIDAGNPSGCTDGQGHLLKTDQRGRPRPDKEDTGGCDMGAYERQKD
jgi:hypothetical protein